MGVAIERAVTEVIGLAGVWRVKCIFLGQGEGTVGEGGGINYTVMD